MLLPCENSTSYRPDRPLRLVILVCATQMYLSNRLKSVYSEAIKSCLMYGRNTSERNDWIPEEIFRPELDATYFTPSEVVLQQAPYQIWTALSADSGTFTSWHLLVCVRSLHLADGGAQFFETLITFCQLTRVFSYFVSGVHIILNFPIRGLSSCLLSRKSLVVKVKVRHRTGLEGPEGSRGVTVLFL